MLTLSPTNRRIVAEMRDAEAAALRWLNRHMKPTDITEKQLRDPFTKCPDCDGHGWTVVAKMKSRTVHGGSGEPEQRWEPEPEQEQCDRCQSTGIIDPAAEFRD